MKIRHVTALLIAGVVLAAQPSFAQWVWTPETGRFVNLGNLPKETPELQIEYTRSLMVEGKLNKAMDETDKFRRFYADSELADENQYLRGEIRLRQGEYVNASEEFQQVISQYPATELYDDVIAQQYEIGDALFEQGVQRMAKQREREWWQLQRYIPARRKKQLRQAADVYSGVIDNQPFTAEAAEAQFKLGRVHMELENYVEAAFEFRRVLEDYRGSEWLDEASYNLAKVYEAGSHPPEYDQEPSQLAIDAAEEFLLTYPNDPQGEEMQQMKAEMREKIATQRYQAVRFYERRSEINAARIYAEGIVVEYPDTEAADHAREWLDSHPARETARARFIGRGYIK